MQALVEAASGPLPPSALLPILRAKETGPGAADLALEVLERITREENNIGGGAGNNNDMSKAAIGEKTAGGCFRCKNCSISGKRWGLLVVVERLASLVLTFGAPTKRLSPLRYATAAAVAIAVAVQSNVL